MNKQCQYILLPTDKSNLVIRPNNKLYLAIDDEIKEFEKDVLMDEEEYWKPQHIYILSDDEIKEGDWLINKKILPNGKPFKKNFNYDSNDAWYKKIIATTDPEFNKPSNRVIGDMSLNVMKNGIPSISQSDVEYIISLYNGNGKDKDPILSLSSESIMSEGEKIMFHSGYNQCLQDNADKMKQLLDWIEKYSISDLSERFLLRKFKEKIQSLTKEQSNDTVIVEYECDEWIPELGVSDPISYKLKLKDGHIIIYQT